MEYLVDNKEYRKVQKVQMKRPGPPPPNPEPDPPPNPYPDPQPPGPDPFPQPIPPVPKISEESVKKVWAAEQEKERVSKDGRYFSTLV